MSDPSKWREQLDACRPGSDDLSLPEFAEARAALAADEAARRWYADRQAQDAALSSVWRDVEVPAGLEQRLLAGLAQHLVDAPADSAEFPSPKVEPAEQLAAAELPAPVARARTGRRRWLLLAVTAAGLVLAGALWWRQPPRLTLEQLSQLSRSLADQSAALAVDADAWKPFEAGDFPALRWRPASWRQVETEYGSAVVFHFPLGDGSRLYLLQWKVPNHCELPPVPYQALSGTGPWKLGAWYETDTLFVAVTNQGRVLESFRAYRAT